MRRLAVLCVYAVVASVTLAHAGGRRTLEPVALRKKPGEKEAVVARLPAGAEVTVLGIDGRWLRVRAGGAEGYVARTTVSSPEDADAAAQLGQWSAGRRAGGRVVGELFIDVVVDRAALRVEPRPDAAAIAALARGTRLTVVDAASDPAWIRARDPAGHDGWIGRAEIDNGASGVVVTGVDLRGVNRPRDDRGGPALRRLAVRADLGIGYRVLGMDLTSNAEGGLTNYAVDAGAMAATLDTDAVLRLGGTWLAGADARLSASDSSPGIDYPGPTAPPGKIPFHTFEADAGARLGARLQQAFDVAARAGVHYDAFVTRSVANAGMLPRERLLGVTLGARVDIAPERSRFAVTARFDALVLGGRAQTAGLQDGTSSTAHALWGGLALRYALGHRLAAFGGFDFGRATTEWSGMSARQPGVTRTRRVDTAQLVQLGISAEL